MYIDILDAGHGDCLLVTCGETLILVDSGPKAIAVRKKLIPKLKAILNGKAIDIAIVTHNDDDHIGSYKYIIEDGIVIKEFIFNSLDLIAKIFTSVKTHKKISFRQDSELHKLISERGIKLRAFKQEDSAYSFNDVTLTALTPNEHILKKLNEKAEEKKSKNRIAGTSRIEPSVAECLKNISANKDNFIEDNSITNKSSISFILEFEGTRALFLADSHPSDIIPAINNLAQHSETFDIVKISHHASEKNTNTELLELLGDTEYIICADKSHNGHPHNVTISRIVNFNPNAKIHMSSDKKALQTIFAECIVQGYPISVTYSKNGVNRIIL